MNILSKSIIRGFFWTSGGQSVVLVISLITNIILARILTPEDFGLIGIILFFTTVANVFVKSGLGGALVRLDNVEENDLKTVNSFNLLVSVFCYILLFYFSESIANFYEEPKLKSLLMVSGLILFVNAFQLVNSAVLIRSMKFKEKSIYQFIATFGASCLAIVGAYWGIGVWALVLLQVGTQFFILLQFICFENFFMKIGWNKASFKKLYSFGVNTTAASLLNTGFNNVYHLILGKYFSVTQVGYFYQAQKLEKVPNGILNYFTQNVLFSGLSKLQNDKSEFVRMYNKTTQLLTVLFGFITIFVFVYGREIILLLYGAEWESSAIYLQLLIIASFFIMQENFNRVIFKVFDKTHQILLLEIVKKVIQSVTILVGIYLEDIMVLIGGFVVSNFISFLINYYFSRKIVSDFSEVLKVGKVVINGILVTILIHYFNEYMQFNDYEIFYSLPVMAGTYFACIQVSRTLNIYNYLKQVIAMVDPRKHQ